MLRNGLIRYILYTCPNLWCNLCSKCYGMDCFGTFFTHVQTCDVARVQSATEWTASVLSKPRFSNLDFRFSIFDSRFSILDFRFSILDSRFSTLDSRFSILNSRFSSLDSRVSILESRFSILDFRFSILDSRFSILDFRFSILDSRLSILDSRFSVLDSRFSFPISTLDSRFSILPILSSFFPETLVKPILKISGIFSRKIRADCLISWPLGYYPLIEIYYPPGN